MPAHRSRRCAVGRVVIVLACSSALCVRGAAQELFSTATAQQHPQITALADRLALQLLAAGKKKPLLLDLTLPSDVSCPLGVWLADQISERMAHAYPELQVLPRNLWNSATGDLDAAHDQNQQFVLKEQRARALGAEILIAGNLAAIPNGVGITLLASDRLVGGSSRFESLAEIPLSSEMDAVLTTPLPQRVFMKGAYRAGRAGIGTPLCTECPPPAYTYVAKAKKLSGVVIVQLVVSTLGVAESVEVIRAPDPALADAAVRTVRNWRFTPAHNFLGESVPAIVDVAVSFRLDAVPATIASARK